MADIVDMMHSDFENIMMGEPEDNYINKLKTEKMKIKDLQKPLEVSEIDFRIQSINNGGYATILAYKDARVDMNRLDEVCGALNWKREHTNGNHNCIVSIWCAEKNQWISKEDTGTESFTEKEKGLASDSFKRACFNWGIGRELYDFPVIQIKLEAHEMQNKNGKNTASYQLRLREWRWEIQRDESGITFLGCKDTNDKLRFKYGTYKKS